MRWRARRAGCARGLQRDQWSYIRCWRDEQGTTRKPIRPTRMPAAAAHLPFQVRRIADQLLNLSNPVGEFLSVERSIAVITPFSRSSAARTVGVYAVCIATAHASSHLTIRKVPAGFIPKHLSVTFVTDIRSIDESARRINFIRCRSGIDLRMMCESRCRPEITDGGNATSFGEFLKRLT